MMQQSIIGVAKGGLGSLASHRFLWDPYQIWLPRMMAAHTGQSKITDLISNSTSKSGTDSN